MDNPQPDIKTIFGKALEIDSAASRAAYLEAACAGKVALRAEVESLLAALNEAGSYMEGPAAARTIEMPAEPPGTTAPGTVIGQYKLLQQIGAGGMGVVYMAEQAAPVRHKVALKIVKPGMDTREVIARFEAERQALALMDHPNIARVFDGGATETGRPYFVMELVRGIPITDYCDENNLPVHERLELFITVCHAVQHAHQKGIIHRDIKPSNVLVTLHDGRPVPKVIDFGVAKAIGQQLTDKTLFTQFAQMVGTPLYMSPEQAELTGQDVDTRGDVYSLGVLLYELLTGTTPFERVRMKQAALDEIRRMIREEDPPSPSARLSTTAGETQTAVAAHRRVDPRGLNRLMRGDLDWIVMKALEKDRTRRYETANAFAADIGRYLSDEPVEACPPSSAYRFRKFARRNRGVLGAAALVGTGLIATLIGLLISNGLIREEQGRTREERTRAVQAQKTSEKRAEQLRQSVLDLQTTHRLMELGRILLAEERWDDAAAAFTRATELIPEYAGPWDARSELYTRVGLFDLAADDLNRAYQLQQPESWRWMVLAILRLHVGDVAGCHDVSAHMRQQIRETGTPGFAKDAIRAAVLLPGVAADFRELVELAQSLVNVEPANAYLRYLLGLAYYRAEQFAQAAAELQEALTLWPAWNAKRIACPVLAMAFHRLGREAEARSALAEAARAIDEWTEQSCRSNNGGNWRVHQCVGTFPVPWFDWVECRLYYREAKLLIDDTLPPADPRLHLLQARALAGLRRTKLAMAEYDAAIERMPDNSQIQFERHCIRGYYYGYRDWPLAAREFAAARRIAPQDSGIRYFEAAAQHAAGNREAYRQLCQEMLEQFAATPDPRAASDIVVACVLEPGSLADPAQLIPPALVAARFHHGNGRLVGAAFCRAGQYAEAIRQLDYSVRLQLPRGWEWCFLAMAHHHLGHTDEARACLQSAAHWITAANQQTTADFRQHQQGWGGFLERCEYSLLYAEAAALIGDSNSTAAGSITETNLRTSVSTARN